MDEVKGPGLNALHLGFLVRVPRKYDDGNVLGGLICLQGRQYLKTIHFRHIDIQEYEVYRLVGKLGQGFRSAGHSGEVVIDAEDSFQRHLIDDIVIYSYYTAAFAYGVIHGIGSSFFLIYVYSILILAKIMVDFYIYAKSGRNMPKVVK